MSDMKKLLEAMDSMSKSEKKSTGPKFPGYLKGTDPASKVRDKMVGGAEESVIKELAKTAKDTSTERKLKEEFANFQSVAKELNEFAPTNGNGKDYLRVLASAWYNDVFNTGDLHKGIKSQEDVERILERGVICPDGKKRKFGIGYNHNFDGVVLASDDYYEYDDGGVDSRTNKPWGPYEYIEYAGDQLDENVTEAHDPEFLGFMNKALSNKVDGAKHQEPDNRPDWEKNAPVMNFSNMSGYKHAFRFGMSIIQSMDPETKQHFAKERDDALIIYMMNIAKKKGFVPKYFVSEDLDEVTQHFDDIFHDPSMTGWSWSDLLRSTLGDRGVAEGSAFDKWADDRAAKNIHKLKRDHSKDKKANSATVQQDNNGDWEQSQIEKMKKYRSPEQGVAEGSLNEFSLGGDDDDTPKDDPYKYPKPEQYRRSIDFFGKFEANHFDKEDMDDATGVFKGYWYYGNKLKQIAYFKFNNPQRTGSDDPGMGWYYEPQDEDISEDDEGVSEFYVYIGREGDGGWIGRISKGGGKWREEGGEGNKPHNWGTAYMSYLTPKEVMQWIRQDYRRHEVAGPFLDDAEAYEYAEQMGGLDEDISEEQVNEKSVSKAQFRTMAAAAKNPEFAKKVGISSKVAKEFHKADKKSNYKSLPNKVDEDGQPDAITMDVPLMIRLFEYAREDAKTDMDLHDVAERLIALSQEGRTLTMQDYDTICPSQEQDMAEMRKLEPLASKAQRDLQRQQGLRPSGPQRLFAELADMLHITVPQLQKLVQYIPGFPPPRGRGTVSQGTKGYYDLATFKRWVIDNQVREKIAAKQSIAEEQEAKYSDKYQAAVKRVGQKAREQEKKKPVDIAALAAKLAAIDKKVRQLKEVNTVVPNAPTTSGGATATQQGQDKDQAAQDLVNTQKNLAKLKTANPQLNPGLATQALQNIDSNPNASVAGAQMAQTKNLADLVGDALADPQKGSQVATILQQVQQAKK